MADGDRGSGFAMGLRVGEGLGLAVGFRFAPQAGKETRQLLREKVGAARERAADITRKVRETAGETVKKAQTKKS